MLTEICGYLKNWFVVKHCFGKFKISDGEITYADGTELPLLPGQYFCILDSVFNNGVHLKSSIENEAEQSALVLPLKDEEFTGSVKCMAIPPDLLYTAEEIAKWNEKYGGAESPSKSPYNSEAFAGYSYSKSNGSGTDSSSASWQGAFASVLNRYRKL